MKWVYDILDVNCDQKQSIYQRHGKLNASCWVEQQQLNDLDPSLGGTNASLFTEEEMTFASQATSEVSPPTETSEPSETSSANTFSAENDTNAFKVPESSEKRLEQFRPSTPTQDTANTIENNQINPENDKNWVLP